MDAPTLPVSAEKNLGDPIEIRVDIVHPAPTDVFAATTVVRTLAQHEEAIRGIHGHLQRVIINEEMNALRFKIGMAKEENASLRSRIKTMEAIDTITRRQEKRARIVMPTTRQGANVVMTLEDVQAMIDQTMLRNNTTDDGSQNSGGGPRRPTQPALFHISGCAVENQVKFATYTLLGATLTWSNCHVRTLGHDAAYAMTWEILKKKLTDKYCPKGETKKLEIKLWNLKVKGNDIGGYTQRF
nr:reverse transcriptase domain-containing protein [Tanacetum cinerariifolium]